MSHKYLYVINNVLQGYDREVVENHVSELEQQKAELIDILKSIAKMKENDENELNRITKEIIDTIEKYK